jgi:hypothetical protein
MRGAGALMESESALFPQAHSGSVFVGDGAPTRSRGGYNNPVQSLTFHSPSSSVHNQLLSKVGNHPLSFSQNNPSLRENGSVKSTGGDPLL